MFLAGTGMGEIARTLKVRSRSTVLAWSRAGKWVEAREETRRTAGQRQIQRTGTLTATRNARFRDRFETMANIAFQQMFQMDVQGNVMRDEAGNFRVKPQAR